MKFLMKVCCPLLLSVIIFPGCATMTRSNQQSIYIDSNPQGAAISSNKLHREAVTPTQIKIEKGGDFYVEIRKEGYINQIVNVERKITPAFWINLVQLYFAPLGMLTDYSSGTMWDYDEKVYAKLDLKDSTQTSHDLSTPPQSKQYSDKSWLTKKMEIQLSSGPRIGFTYMSKKLLDKIKQEEKKDISSISSQFGWQFEKEIDIEAKDNRLFLGILPLISGIDQDILIPSVSGIVGFRTSGGVDVGFGPTINTLESAMYYSVGYTHGYGIIKVPVNLILMRGKTGVQSSIVTGFNW